MSTKEEKLTALCKKLRDGVVERDSQIAALQSQLQSKDCKLAETVSTMIVMPCTADMSVYLLCRLSS